MSTNIFNRDDGNKVLSYAQIDKDFDNFWENEARNPVRNRIRIGRQYQAIVPSLLKPNETDKHKIEQRETLKWTPENELNQQQLEQYLQLAKAVSMFAKVVDKNENSTSTTSNDETGNETSTVKDEKTEDNNNDELNNLEIQNKFKLIFKSLSQFVNAHHPIQTNPNCKLVKSANENKLNDEEDKNEQTDELMKLPISKWTEKEFILFAATLQACGQKFSSIKKEFLPWKSSKNIIDYYHLCLNQANEDKSEDSNEDNKQLNGIEDELRKKLDARSADGKDTNLKECSVDINSIILDLIKANSNNYALRESNKKDRLANQHNDKDSDDQSPINNLFNSSSLNSDSLNNNSSAKSTNLRSSKAKSTSEDKSKKEQCTNEKKNKNFKSSASEKRTSSRSSNKNQSKNQLAKQQSSLNSNQNNKSTKQEPKDEYEFNEYEFDDKLESTDCLGSLKFYKDGQLVLKLNAKQADSNKQQQCHWEESADSIELNKLRRSFKKKRIEINKSKEPLEQNKQQTTTKIKNEDQDDSSFESDDDSRASSDCNPLIMNNLFKKAKVKVENHYIPALPTLNCLKEDERDLELSQRKSISPNDKLMNDDDLKRKLRSPKNGQLAKKKNRTAKLNECTNELINKLNITPNLIEQLTAPSNTLDQKQQLTLINQLNLLSSLSSDLNGISALNNLNVLNNLVNNQQQQNNLNQLLASIASTNTFLENIDSIKMKNQIECLMSNLSEER